MVTIRSPQEVEKLREANQLTAKVLRETAQAAVPGITTNELDRLAERRIREAGAIPAFKGYRGYPKTICSSIDEEVVHGIPSDRELKEGHILSIDLGVKLGGYFGDAAVTVPIGRISDEKRLLLSVTSRALNFGIAQAVAGNTLADIARAVENEVKRNGFSVVRQYGGHGIGTELHEDPRVPNYAADAPRLRLRHGMVLAIEPMVTAGRYKVKVLDDMWTVVTCDGMPSAHFEHTVVVMDNEADVLTALPADAER